MTNTDRGFAVTEHAPTGRTVWVFDDEDLAMQFAVRVGSQVEPFCLDY